MGKKIIMLIINLLIVLVIIVIILLTLSKINAENMHTENKAEVLEADNVIAETYCSEDVQKTTINSELPAYKSDEQMGSILVPSQDLEIPLFVGNPEDDFKYAMEQGVAWDSDTGLPGVDSSMVVSGHRNYDFKYLQYLEVGDDIILSIGENTYTYEVSYLEVIDESEADKVYTNTNELVMYTCYPFISGAPKDERYVVHATPVDSIGC